MKRLQLLCLPLLLAACQKLPPAEPAQRAVAPETAVALDGHALARASCAQCHSVEREGRSPYSYSPPFPVIVNKEGLTAETLATWLRGAHNYPREMDFYLGDPQVDALVEYMLTLRDPNFKRPPD